MSRMLLFSLNFFKIIRKFSEVKFVFGSSVGKKLFFFCLFLFSLKPAGNGFTWGLWEFSLFLWVFNLSIWFLPADKWWEEFNLFTVILKSEIYELFFYKFWSIYFCYFYNILWLFFSDDYHHSRIVLNKSLYLL